MSGKGHDTGKRANLEKLAELVRLEPPSASGGTIPRDWLEALIHRLSPNAATDGLTKLQLLRVGIARLGGQWRDDFVSEIGSTITGDAVAYLLELIVQLDGAPPLSESVLMTESADAHAARLLEDLLDAGDGSQFREIVSKALRKSPAEIADLAPGDLLKPLAVSQNLEWPDESGPSARREAVISLAASLDDRIPVIRHIHKLIGRGDPLLGLRRLLERVYEDEIFVGSAAPDELSELVLGIMESCDEEVSADDLDEFLEDGSVKLFCVEMIQARLEELADDGVGAARAAIASPAADSQGADEAEEEEDASYDPVKANVKTFTVKTLFEYVEAGQLDLRPPWQRKDVWSRKKKRELIKSLLLGIPLPSIILHRTDQGISIIDGKQRLTSIVQFMSNEFKLPTFDAPPGHPLHDCRGAWFNKPSKKSLPQEVRQQLELRDVPALLFEDVPEQRLRKIFHLYNVSGTRLNPAEIRNAVYQSNPIHQAMYVLAGEQHTPDDLGTGDFDEQLAFTQELRAVLPSVKRYAAVDFLCRYLGYSRAAVSDPAKPFRPSSTSTAINRYFDYASGQDDPVEVTREIIEALHAAQRFFDISDERLPFYRRDEKGQRKFNALVAVSNMIGARLLLDAITDGSVTPDRARAAAEAVDLDYPDNQQSSTIWDYQARLLVGLRDELGVEHASFGRRDWRPFFVKMQHALIPSELAA